MRHYPSYNKSERTAQVVPVTVKAPYNFVPLSERVFLPDWADRISQDIPFRDGLTGSISFDIVAKTPIFVRNGQSSENKDSSFCRMPDGTYFLPATSLKGEIANVLRILSFGKAGLIDNKSFGNRNLNNRDYREQMSQVHCGWMRMTERGVVIEDCDIPGRISIQRIDEKFGTHLDDFVKNKDNFKKDENRTAKKKYELLKGKDLRSLFIQDTKVVKTNIDTREFVTFSSKDNDGECGRLVFTGQPGVRKYDYQHKKWTGKYYEFVFFEYNDKVEIEVPEAIFRAFETIHASSPDYVSFWKKKLYNGEEIPVFFLLNQNGNSIHSIGLSYLYKYPFEKKVYDAIPPTLLTNARDLNECVFGTTENNAIKGRVSFSHAKASGHPQALPEQKFILSQPRPSFSPFYVQDGKDWDKAVVIAGRKRYPIRLGNPLPSPTGTKEMETSVSMLPAGTLFKETIRFHNLRPVELGAILSAVTFHGNQDTCFHSIGFGKPLGYGAVSIENIVLDGCDMDENRIGPMNDYIAAFEEAMIAFDDKWLSSPQLKELLLMAQGIPSDKESTFEYMELADFREVKKQQKSLPSFSTRVNRTNYSVKSIKEKR